MPKRTRLTILRIIVPCCLALMATAALATQEKPVLALNIPTIQFTNIVVVNDPAGFRTIDVPWIGEYVTGVYSYAVGIAGTLAGVMFVIGGFQYLTAGGDANRVKAAKERIKDAFIGMLLVLGAYMTLVTLNPKLTTFDALNIRTVAKKSFTAEEREDYADTTTPSATPSTGTTSSSSGGATAVCRNLEDCRTMCARGPSGWPTSTPGVMDPAQAVTIPSTVPGLRGNGIKASQAVIDGLTRAAAIAHGRGYTISVSSGYRPLRTQIELVCARMGNAEREAGIGTAVAWPGGSNHGAGYAVDLQLIRDSDSRVVVGSGNCSGQAAGSLATRADSQLFDQIMTEAGAKRYSNEIWHYEFGSSSSCRCQYPSCPSPPIPCNGNC
ncbi:MAG TPA: D-alanyl-D-alanine carboxypeptidase family protein [Patescibacteria group bacterium]|nr:D-alanyl-D-alanine carboxypeptidase family protein [Patescibacteria group bacterium]